VPLAATLAIAGGATDYCFKLKKRTVGVGFDQP
jgi:hypothetical protein